jgi:hypothetical protein
MNSANIAPILESLRPTPSLHLDAELHGPITEAAEGLGAVVWWRMLARAKDLLPERSASYFMETRKATFGASLEELAVLKGGPEAWEAAAAPGGPAEKLRDVLTKHRKDEGPFALGSQPSYGDFIAAGMFECFERCHPEDYEKLVGLDPTFRALHEACRPWLVRDD